MRRYAIHAVVSCFAASLAAGQATSTAPATPPPLPLLAVGSTAPDFKLGGATRYGLLATPVRLSDYRGQTVVLAFFYEARTKG